MSGPLPQDDGQLETSPNASQKTELGDLENASQPHQDPPSEWELLREQLRAKPTDADSWLRLVDIAVDSGQYDKINETYEGLLEAYPNTVHVLPTLLA